MLRPEERTKLDLTDDLEFYSYPRFVTHVDNNFINRLQDLYRERLKPNTRILDLMSSWVSHLPEDMEFSHIEGHGANKEELAKNPRLNSYFVRDLNKNPQLPLADNDFDAVLNTVSVQYLQYPEAIFSEIHRILRPGGIAIISFSNRMFYQKAISVWRDGSEMERIRLVKRYFENVPGFSSPEAIATTSKASNLLQMLGIGYADPFYAVICQKQ
jgi:SAM-dependent methyltransferase